MLVRAQRFKHAKYKRYVLYPIIGSLIVLTGQSVLYFRHRPHCRNAHAQRPAHHTAFGLESFADLLPARNPIIGEDAGSFDRFHGAMVASLGPTTPYECVIAENLIAIEWELTQHRRMRDASLRQIIQSAIFDAFVSFRQDEHKRQSEGEFDQKAAEEEAMGLVERALSSDAKVQAEAYGTVYALGMDPVEVMGEAYSTHQRSVTYHDNKLRELEVRRREVRRDYDALQRSRPVEARVIEP